MTSDVKQEINQIAYTLPHSFYAVLYETSEEKKLSIRSKQSLFHTGARDR